MRVPKPLVWVLHSLDSQVPLCPTDREGKPEAEWFLWERGLRMGAWARGKGSAAPCGRSPERRGTLVKFVLAA